VSLLNVLIASTLLFVLLHWVWLPRTTRRLEYGVGPEGSLALVAKLATLRFARTLCALFAISAAGVGSYVASLQPSGDSNAAALHRALVNLRSFRDSIYEIGFVWSIGSSALLVLILIWIVRRASRARAGEAMKERIERAVAELRRKKADGTLEALPPNEMLAAIDAELAVNAQHRAALLSSGTIRFQDERGARVELNAKELDEDARSAIVATLDQRSAALRQIREELDLRRRIDPKEIKLDPESWAAPPARTFLGRVAGAFATRGTTQGIRGISRLVYTCSLLLLLPSLTAISAGIAAGSIQQRIVAVEDLQIATSTEEAEKSWSEATSTTVEAELTAADEAAIDALSESYEREVLAKVTARPMSRAMVGAAQQAAARRRILAAAKLAPQVSVTNGAGAEQRHVAEAIEVFSKHTGQGPKTALGLRMREDLRELARAKDPSWRETLKTKVGNLSRPAGVDDVTHAIVGNVLGQGGEMGNAASELARQLHDVKVEQSERLARRMFTAELANTADPERALAKVGQTEASWRPTDLARLRGLVNDQLPRPEAISRHLDEGRVALEARPEAHVQPDARFLPQ
jgi:hypothetical protein